MIDIWNDIWLELNECIIREVNEKDYHRMVEVAISFMGWSKSRKEIVHKKRFPSGHSYVEADILIQKDGESQWVVEVKEPTHKQIREDLNQLFSYMRLAKLPVGLYIGEFIEVFYDKKDCSEPVSVLKLDIVKDSQQGAILVELLHKDNYSLEKAIAFCEQCVLEKQKKETLKEISNRLVSKEGSAFIVNVFKESLLADTKMNFSDAELDEIFAGLTLKIFSKANEEELSEANFVPEPKDDDSQIAGISFPYPLGDDKPIVFTFKQTKIKAVATLHFYRKSKRFILKAGSTIKAAHESSCLQSHIQLRKKFFSDPEICEVKDALVLLKKDLEIPELNSPSALAIFCCGGSRNGPQSWIDSNGKKYSKEWWAGEDEVSAEANVINTKLVKVNNA